MKKTQMRQTVWAAALFVCCIALFTTCKDAVGLGGSIDINPPAIDASKIYPPVGSVIREHFILSAAVSDDTQVTAVTATIVDADTGEQLDGTLGLFNLKETTAVTQTADGTRWTRWEASLNEKDGTKVYPLKDGNYKVKLLVKDGSGKDVRAETAFTVDNTPPLLILNRPSTAIAAGASIAKSSPDVFGADFLLVGQVYDESPVAALKITAEGSNGEKHEKTLEYIPQNIRITVDSFSNKTKAPFYQPLYGPDENAGKKNYTYGITVTDSAKVYRTPDNLDASENSSGNSTHTYYLFDSLYTDVLSKYKIQDVYAMMRGSYTGGGGRSIVDQKIAENINKILAANQLGGEKQGSFALNPSLNPRFAIAGEEPVARPENASEVPTFSRLYSGSMMKVRLNRNLDEVPLEDSDTYRFFLMEWKNFLAYAGDSAYPTEKINGIGDVSIYADEQSQTLKPELAGKLIKIINPTVEKEGGNYLFTLAISESLGIGYGKSYVLLVRGKDKNGNSLMPDLKTVKGGAYGFTLVKTGKAPEVLVTEVNGKPGTGADGNITERVYLTAGDSLQFKMKLRYVGAAVTYRLLGAVGGDVVQTETYSIGDHNVTIDSSKFSQTADGTYKLIVKAQADEGASLEQTYTIVYDVKGPEVRIAYPVGNLNGSDGTSLEIQGTAFDTGSGLAANPLTITLTKEGGSPQTVTLAKNGGTWKSNPVDLSVLPNYGDGKYTLKVTAKDAVGNEKTETLTFIYDAAAPVITGLQIDGQPVSVDPLNRVNTTGTVTVTGTITESYELDVFTIKSGSNTYPISLSSRVFSQALSLTEGSHDIEIRVVDKAGKETKETITAVVDTASPLFQDMNIAGQAVSVSGQTISTNSPTVAMKGKIAEAGSGVKKLEYKVQGDTNWTELNAVKKPDGYYHFEGSASVASNSTKQVSLQVTDYANHITSWDCTVTVFSTTASITLEVDNPLVPYVNANGVYYRKPPVKLKITGTTTVAPPGPLTVTVQRNGSPETSSNFFSAADAGIVTSLRMNNTVNQEFTTKADLSDGEYTIKAENDDAPARTVTLVIDTEGPSIAPVTPQVGGIIRAGGTLQAVLSDIAGIAEAKAYYQKEGGSEVSLSLPTASPYTVNLPASLDKGKYEVWFYAKDRLGNERTSSKMTVWNDTENPALTDVKVNGKDGVQVYSNSSTVALTGKATDDTDTSAGNGVEKIEVLKNGASIKNILGTAINASTHEWTITFTGSELVDGTHNLTIRATDKSGKTAEVQRTVVVDTTPPNTITLNTVDGTVVGSLPAWLTKQTLKFEGTASDTAGGSGIAQVEAILNSGTPTTINGTDSWVGYLTLHEGTNTVKFKVTDKAGNEKESSEHTIKVDTGIPTIELTTPANGQALISGTSYQVTVSYNDPVGGSGIQKIEYADTDTFASPPPLSLTPSPMAITLNGIPAAGKTYYFRAVDVAGNKSTAVRVNIQVDSTPPTITIVSPMGAYISTRKPKFEASISDSAGIKANTAKVHYKKDGGHEETELLTLSSGSYSFTPLSDLNGTSYEFWFTAEDSLGNRAETTPHSTVIIDTDNPVLTEVHVNGKADVQVYSNSSSVALTGKATDTNGVEKIEVLKNGASIKNILGTAINASTHEWTITFTGSELIDGTHNLTIRATDKSGKTAEVQRTVVVDTTPPNTITLNTVDGTAVGSLPAWLTKQTLKFEGTASDTAGGSGIAKVEAILNSGTPIQVDGTDNWSRQFTLHEGTNTVKFKVTDKAGKTKESSEHTIKVDTSIPTIELTTPANGQALTSGTSCQVTVTTADPTGGSTIQKVQYSPNADFSAPVTDHLTGSGSVPITVNGISGDITYYFRAVDVAGNKSTAVRVAIQKDREDPSVEFTSHTNDQKVNKKITIRGSAGDDRELKFVKIENVTSGSATALAGVSDSSGYDTADPETAADKALFKGTKAYNWYFTLNTEAFSDNHDLKLKATAIDAADRSKEAFLTLKVDQHSDRPQIVITNLNTLAAGTYLTTSTLNFVIIDDDGEIEDGKFEITSEPAAAGTLAKTMSGWQYTFAADGEKKLKFKVTDKQGGVFETAATAPLDKPRLYPKDTNGAVSEAALELQVDTQSPQSENPPIQFSKDNSYNDLVDLVQNAKFKGGTLFLQVTASDASGIQSVTGKIDSVTSVSGAQNVENVPRGAAEKWRLTLNLNAVSEGTKTLTIELTDKAGAKTQFTRTITVDKTAPAVELTYPDPADPQAGEITVSGTIMDTGVGVNAAKTKYILGKKNPAPTVSTPDYHATTAPHGWKPMETSTKGSWTVKLNLDSVPTAEQGDPSGSYKRIPLYIFTEDEIGNQKVHEKEILFDPDGTKPIVKILSPRQTSPATKLGGTIQIFGTASAPKGGPAAVGEVYIQFSHDGTFTNAADGTFGSTDWFNDTDHDNIGDGVVIPDTVTNGGADWRISINGDGSFNHATNQNQDVYFRVRAKNKDGASIGQWTEKIKIIVDKSAPTIGSPNAVKVDDSSSTAIAGSANAKDYTPNMWVGRNKKLIGSLKDDSGIKAVRITSTGLAGGVDYDLATAKAQNWIADAAGGNYELQIPFDLDTLSSTAKEAGEFSVTISITENTTSPELSTQQTFTFRFDTTDPIGDFGTERYVSLGNFTSSSITDAQLAQKVKDLGATTSSGGGCRILADNHILTVTKVTGDKIEFTASPALTAGSHSYILYKPETLIYKNSSGKWIVNGVANDVGSGVAEVKAHVSVNGVNSPETVINETHPTNRITKQLGGTVTWKGALDFGTVSDGKGKLHYTITDKSGNTYTTPGVDVVVKNKPVTVSKVTLKTKIGGIDVETDKPGATETDPQTTVTKNTDANLDQTVTVESKNFAFKSTTDSKIKVEFDGTQQGTLKYRLKKGTSIIGTDLRTVPSDKEIVLTAADLAAIHNSNGTPTTITLEFWDQAYGFTQGLNSACSKVDIATLFDAIDDKAPTVVILPFHWNSETDNSLYQNKRANGHVEIAPVAGIGNTHSSVSGKVTLRGFAYDNIKIDSIKAEVPGKTLTATLSGTGSTWTAGAIASDGAVLTVEKLGADYLGYYVSWKLDWDTEKTTTVGFAQNIKVTANDGTTTFSDTGVTTAKTPGVTRSGKKSAENAVFANKKPGQFVVFTKGETQYLTRIRSVIGNRATLEDDVPTEADEVSMYTYSANEPKTTVNVVPYITGITTGLDKAYTKKPSVFNRSATGAYPVKQGETIQIQGFNIGTNTAKVTIPGMTADTQLVASGTLNNTITLASAESGDIVLKVGSVEAINNKNTAPVFTKQLDGTYTVSEKAYNAESNGINNTKLTDDRRLAVWKFNDIVTDPAVRYPTMRVGKDANQTVGFVYDSGAQSVKMNRSHNDYWIDYSYTQWYDTAVAVDKAGRMYGSAMNGDSGGHGNQSHGGYANYGFYAWNTNNHPGKINNSTLKDTQSVGMAYANGTKKVALENSKNNSTFSANRIKNPKIAVSSGTSISSEGKVYTVYYESLANQVRFRYGTVNGTVASDNQLSFGGALQNHNNNAEGSGAGYQVVAGTGCTGTSSSTGTTNANRVGEYAAVGVDGATAIIAWYDAENQSLLFSYNDTPSNSSSASQWGQHTRVVDSDFAGWYVDMVVDENHGIHIAYYGAAAGDLKYAYLPKYDSTAAFDVVTVDSYLSVGTNISIDVMKKTVGSNTYYVPYISCFMSSFTKTRYSIRTAWLNTLGQASVPAGVAKDEFTGDWEVMTVPTDDVPLDYTIGIGIKKNGSNNDSALLGYGTKNGLQIASLE